MTRTPPAAGSRPLGVPSPSSGQSRGFLAILAVLLLAAAAPAQEPARLFPARAADRGGPGGYVSLGPLFYDTEGRAGVYRPDLDEFQAFTLGTTESGDRFWSYFGGEGFIPGLTPGEAFFWEHTSLVPGYESIVGMGVVDSYYWGGGPRGIYPIFPVPASLTGTGLEEKPYAPSTGSAMAIQSYFADSRTLPTVCTRIEAAPGISSRRMRVTAEYLEGNAIFGSPPESREWDNPVTFAPDVAAAPLWGSAFSTSPEAAIFSRTLPLGPVRVTLELEGFHSDSVTFDLSAAKAYYWDALLVPVASVPDAVPSPVDVFPLNYPAAFSTPSLQVVDWTVLYTGALAVDHHGNPLDPNRDDVKDVADLVHAMSPARSIHAE